MLFFTFDCSVALPKDGLYFLRYQLSLRQSKKITNESQNVKGTKDVQTSDMQLACINAHIEHDF